MMTDDTTAPAAEQKLAPKSSPSKPLPANPNATPPAALAIHACLKDHYKELPLERVAEDLAYAVELAGSRRKVLNQQVYALDALFSQALIDTPKDLEHLPLLNMALRAQRQCQLTSASLSTQKKSDKRNDSSDPLISFLNAKF